MRDYLDTLVEAKGNYEWRASDPHKFAYRLREAFKVAVKFKEQYPSYAGLKDKYSIRVTSGGVVATLKDTLDIQPAHHGKITIKEAVAAMEIVGAALQHKAPIMHFPNANMAEQEIGKLRRWCEISEYTLEVTNNDGIYLTRKPIQDQ